MKTLVTSAVIAGLIGIASPAPVQAQDNNNVAGVIAGIVALGLLAKAIDDHNDRDRARAAAAARANSQLSNPPRDTWGRLGGYEDRQRARTQRLPEQCLRRIVTDRGDRNAYSRHCLRRNYARADRLPSSCERQVQTQRGPRTVYAARCLKRNGYRVEARRVDD